MVAIDSFRAIADAAPGRSEIWRFLGEFSRQLIVAKCLGLLVGEYLLPGNLDLPEFAMADSVIYLDVERQLASDIRSLRIYKLRGGSYGDGRWPFAISDNGIEFLT